MQRVRKTLVISNDDHSLNDNELKTQTVIIDLNE